MFNDKDKNPNFEDNWHRRKIKEAMNNNNTNVFFAPVTSTIKLSDVTKPRD